MQDTSESSTWTRTAQGYHIRDDHTQPNPVGRVAWQLGADSDVDHHGEEIPLTLMRGTHIGPRGVEAEVTFGTQPLLQHYRRPSVDGHDPNPVEDPPKQHAVIGSDEPSHATEYDRSWRPTWLRPAIVLAFMALFLVLAISLPLLFWYSQEHEGIAKSRTNFVYLWRFGPTAVITVISVLWSRVELQVLRYEPWITHFHEQLAAKRAVAYGLDYTSFLPPTVLIRSLREGHYFVFLVSMASLILKIQIALAPGVFSSASIEGRQPVDVRVLDFFNTSIAHPNSLQTIAYYSLQAFHNFEMRYPFGLTQTVAYQTFGIGDENSRGTIDAPVDVTVDAFFSDTQCVNMKNHTLKRTHVNEYFYTFTVELQFEECETVLAQNYTWWTREKDVTSGFQSDWINGKILPRELTCRALVQETEPRLYTGLRFEIQPGNNSQPVLLDIAAVLCASNSWISRVKVVDDGDNPIVTILPNETKTPVKTKLWDLIGSIVPPEASSWSSGGPAQTEYALWENGNYSTLEKDPSLYRNEVLYQASMSASRALGPWASHYQLRRRHGDTYSRTTGFRTTKIDKLFVNKWVSLSMTVLFLILTFSAFLILLRYRRKSVVRWYRDPATILGSMLLLRDNTHLTSQVPIPASHLPPEKVYTSWNDCRYTPFVLRTWVRITFLVFVVSIFAALCFTAAISRTSEGLATIVDMHETYWELLWTSLPAVFMLSIALYISSCDSAHRNLAVLSSLAQKPRRTIDLDMSFIDMLGLLSMYHSIKMRLIAVTLSQVLVVLCGFLATLISVVFTVENVPYSETTHVQQTTWFGSRKMEYTDDSRTRRKLVGILVLRQGDARLTWPPNTYDDLVFPNISAAGGVSSVSGDSQNTSISLVIPAAKLHPTCTKLPNFEYNILFDALGGEPGTTFEVTFSEPFACADGGRGSLESASNHSVTYADGISYVASILKSPGNRKDTDAACGRRDDDGGGSDDNYSADRYQTYVWGKFSYPKKDLEYLTTWRCKYTWLEVPTEISLTAIDGEYVLDPDIRPRPDASNTRPWSPEFDVPHINDQFDDREKQQVNYNATIGSVFPQVYHQEGSFGGMPDVFKVIIQPHGRINLDEFGDPSRDASIIGEINHNYAAFAAQLASLENRFGVNETSRTGPLPQGSLPDLVGTFTDRGRHRLIQNATITYVILGILGLVFVVHVTAMLLNIFRRVDGETWIFDMQVKGLAPDSLHSIAATVALLKDSNVSAYLPEGAQLLSLDELHGQLANLRFRMGWFRGADQDRKFTIGVIGDDDFKFLGMKKNHGKENT